MNNNYLSGNDLYPKSVVAAMTYLSHFSSGVTFAQYGDNRTCYRCGEKGHIATDSPKNKMNADQVAEGKILELPNAGYVQKKTNRFVLATDEARMKG